MSICWSDIEWRKTRRKWKIEATVWKFTFLSHRLFYFFFVFFFFFFGMWKNPKGKLVSLKWISILSYYYHFHKCFPLSYTQKAHIQYTYLLVRSHLIHILSYIHWSIHFCKFSHCICLTENWIGFFFLRMRMNEIWI